ncbi:DUF6305 family protein [candidate division KSB1 bacterium]
MKRFSKILLYVFLIGVFIVLSFPSVFAQDKEIKAELPVLITSCGQSPGPTKIKAFIKRLKYDHVYNTLSSAEDLAAKKDTDTPFKTIIIVTGASQKGMGAAGISIKDELERTKSLIAEAKKQGIKIIGAHIGGMQRRAKGASPGDNTDELSIDAVCPESDLLIIKKEGNEDGRFTAISKEKNIPMIEFEKYNEMTKIFKNLFEK